MNSLLFFLLLSFIIAAYFLFRKKKPGNIILTPGILNAPDFIHSELLHHVPFYTALSDEQKKVFVAEVKEFLSKVKVVGVDTTANDLDKILIAAGAVIPLFGFPDWFYRNLDVVELYADTFNHDFETAGTDDRNIFGMVGTGAMSRRMSLSQKALRAGFGNATDKRNTSVHEFVHLIDMSDGATDGIPEILLDKKNSLAWIEYARTEIERIKEGESDINRYGSTSQTEFLAVAAEYFFERPQLFSKKHPELYDLMAKAFRKG